VDDGSTDATAQVARRSPVRLLCGGRLGLSGARNLGLAHAEGEIVAYIDADAQADPDWLTYLALALEAPGTAAAGGPNPVPPDDPPVAQCVARAPGGPIHVLLDNERAEHVPGCNMAFRRERLLEVGGFDPTYWAAGDDLDVCWRLLASDCEIRFHPSALVWHRRRDSIRAFWRQQVTYGKAEALVERNHPDKFNGLGQAAWRGVIYGPTSILPRRGRVYSGRFGDAPFQRLYGGQDHLGPFWAPYLILGLLLILLPAALLSPYLLAVPAVGLAALASIYAWRGAGVARRERLRPAWRLGPLIGLLHLLQPVARAWGRLRARWPNTFPPNASPRTGSSSWALRSVGAGLFSTEGVEEVGRDALLEGLRDRLWGARLRTKAPSGWEEADLICDSALFWRSRMVSYEAWGAFYLRLVFRPRFVRLAVPALGIASVLLWSPAVAAGALAGLLAVLVLERRLFARKIRRALTGDPRESSRG